MVTRREPRARPPWQDGYFIGGHPALDLTNTARTRCVTATQGSILVMCQANDLDMRQHEPILRAMQASLKITD